MVCTYIALFLVLSNNSFTQRYSTQHVFLNFYVQNPPYTACTAARGKLGLKGQYSNTLFVIIQRMFITASQFFCQSELLCKLKNKKRGRPHQTTLCVQFVKITPRRLKSRARWTQRGFGLVVSVSVSRTRGKNSTTKNISLKSLTAPSSVLPKDTFWHMLLWKSLTAPLIDNKT